MSPARQLPFSDPGLSAMVHFSGSQGSRGCVTARNRGRGSGSPSPAAPHPAPQNRGEQRPAEPARGAPEQTGVGLPTAAPRWPPSQRQLPRRSAAPWPAWVIGRRRRVPAGECATRSGLECSPRGVSGPLSSLAGDWRRCWNSVPHLPAESSRPGQLTPCCKTPAQPAPFVNVPVFPGPPASAHFLF